MDSRIGLLLQLIDSAYDHRSWHGTNLRGSLRGLSVADVSWRPKSGRHNIREIVVHAAYWKFCVRRHLTGRRDERFPRRGSNWFPLPEPALASHLKSDLTLLEAEHGALRQAVALFPASRLERTPVGLRYRFEQYIQGVASHDLYHAGQIQLIKRLMK